MSGRVLVAGVGNIFLADDGFGVEVARRLAGRSWPEHVKVADFGIRGVHLAYELIDGYDTLILVDAVGRGDAPGTVSVIEPDLSAGAAGCDPGDGTLAAMDAHGMNPQAVLAMVGDLGGHLDRVVIVGCEPAGLDEGIGLSGPVAAAVEVAVRIVEELVASGWSASPPPAAQVAVSVSEPTQKE